MAENVMKPDFLFVVHDAGETLALKPVFEVLRRASSNFKVLVMGTARTLLEKAEYIIDLNEDCHIEPRVDRETWPRQQPLSAMALEQLTSRLTPRVVICGVSTMIQHQIVQAYQALGVVAVVYHESLCFTDSDSSLLNQVLASDTTRFMVSSHLVARQITGLNRKAKITVVGQPAFDEWHRAAEQFESTRVRELLAPDRRFDSGKKTILYSGTYCTDHRQLFELFARSVPGLSHFNIVGSLHPKVDGALERELLAELKIENVILLPAAISTMQAAALSDLVVCHRSTVGLQAMCMKKPVIFLDIPGSPFTDIAVANGWAHIAYTVDNFKAQVAAEFARPSAERKDIFELAELPQKSTETIVRYLRSLLPL